MQPILIATDYPDLYRFLTAMAEVSYSYLGEPKLAAKNPEANTILVWSPGPHSTLFDSCDKLELVELYAKKLGATITLSAAADAKLQGWGRQVGWKVLWDRPSLDYGSSLTNIDQEDDAETIAC